MNHNLRIFTFMRSLSLEILLSKPIKGRRSQHSPLATNTSTGKTQRHCYVDFALSNRQVQVAYFNLKAKAYINPGVSEMHRGE